MKSTREILSRTEFLKKYDMPEWKAFSTTIRRERQNACQCCKRSDKPTHVHHPFYKPGAEPWQYSKEEVVLLCDNCHEELHEQLNNFRRYVFTKMTPRVLQVINGALAVALDHFDPLVFAHALAEFVSGGCVGNRATDFGIEKKEKREWTATGGEPTKVVDDEQSRENYLAFRKSCSKEKP